MGKGSSPRPYSVSQEEFQNNYDLIFGKKKPEVNESESTTPCNEQEQLESKPNGND